MARGWHVWWAPSETWLQGQAATLSPLLRKGPKKAAINVQQNAARQAWGVGGLGKLLPHS